MSKDFSSLIIAHIYFLGMSKSGMSETMKNLMTQSLIREELLTKLNDSISAEHLIMRYHCLDSLKFTINESDYRRSH